MLTKYGGSNTQFETTYKVVKIAIKSSISFFEVIILLYIVKTKFSMHLKNFEIKSFNLKILTEKKK